VNTLKKTKKLELQIDEFLDFIINGALIFKQAVKFYLNGEIDQFEERLKEIDKTESDADTLRRTIEEKLYVKTLIPENRGDVLGLLESTDKVMNLIAETLAQFSVEIPKISADVQNLFFELTEATISSVEYLVTALRSYFTNITLVRDNIQKVIFYEKESDKIADKIKRTVFQSSNLELAEKIHMRYFVYHIERIADEAEDVCDRLSIAVIKRYL
jgi:hypothetical protein